MSFFLHDGRDRAIFFFKYSDSIIFLTRMCCHVCCPLKSLLLGCHAAGAAAAIHASAAALHGSTVDIFDPEKGIPKIQFQRPRSRSKPRSQLGEKKECLRRLEAIFTFRICAMIVTKELSKMMKT